MFSIKFFETLLECCTTASVTYQRRSEEARVAQLEIDTDPELRDALEKVVERNEYRLHNAAAAYHQLTQMLEKEKAKCEDKQP